MRKIFAVLMSILLVTTGISGMAETPVKEDYTVISVNGAFSIRGITPDGYQLTDTQNQDSMIWAKFCSEEPGKPFFDLVISYAEEYAGVKRLNDLSDEERMELVDDDPTLSDRIDIMETDYGTEVMILRSKNQSASEDYVCFVTIYNGYEIALNLFPGRESTSALTDEQIASAMKFLSDLDFIPVQPGQ